MVAIDNEDGYPRHAPDDTLTRVGGHTAPLAGIANEYGQQLPHNVEKPEWLATKPEVLGMENLTRSAFVLFAVAVLAACDLPRSSQQICDCQFLEGEGGNTISRLERAPAYFAEDEYWEDWLRSMDNPEFVRAFRKGTTHWYRDEQGQAHACVVAEGSDQMNAYIVLSDDESRTEPLDARMVGPVYRSPRLFWERC